ncbi:hypothetical protein PGQ11_014539 [Apiospora arundinis]|uniref:Uncharacterized protein n=1 Tax=Apiospora arundinis TaxID=335852 RepID=A0ABR2HSJ8_9PEZI
MLKAMPTRHRASPQLKEQGTECLLADGSVDKLQDADESSGGERLAVARHDVSGDLEVPRGDDTMVRVSPRDSIEFEQLKCAAQKHFCGHFGLSKRAD